MESPSSATASAAAAAAAKRVQIEKAHNFMRQYRDPESRELKKLSANQFMDVWAHYDKDGNGYIEGTELDGFLREFVSSANATDISPEAVTDTMLEELKSCFMEAYDDNQDGKIDIRELAQLLPMEENFLLLFRFDNPLESSVEFMKIWREYDTDNSGYIEADELKNFLRDLLKEAKKINDVSEDKLIEYTDTMLQVFDANKDGRLQLSEMAKLLPVKENFLCRQVFKVSAGLFAFLFLLLPLNPFNPSNFKYYRETHKSQGNIVHTYTTRTYMSMYLCKKMGYMYKHIYMYVKESTGLPYINAFKRCTNIIRIGLTRSGLGNFNH
ncbi:calbindin-32-like isoform X2 [Anastrepha ludens]|uniref:calbindin-32-like isoform X2 n=1 Tax=Anastrepha ludens TaxID=28586 RepID=UPI0023B0E58B|nr:calbindin-32-like isoform X2 [Anastrepha ludens]